MQTTEREDRLVVLALAELAYAWRGTEVEDEALELLGEIASEHDLEPNAVIQRFEIPDTRYSG